MNFITFPGSRRVDFIKFSISAVHQPAEQNLLHVVNTFNDENDVKRTIQENKVFRFSSQQFKTDDGCFFKQMNRVSILIA